MLVLSRKLREKIVIGDGITITVCRIGNDAVRIGIDAPPQVPIVRGELLQGQRPQDGQAGTVGTEQ